MNIVPFDVLEGEIITEIHSDSKKSPEQIFFSTDSGRRFVMQHDQECCENVYLEDRRGSRRSYRRGNSRLL